MLWDGNREDGTVGEINGMKYLFINSVVGSGSTGKIIAEKCRDLQKQGHQCKVAYGRWKANCDDLETYLIGTRIDYCLHGIRTRLFDEHGFGSKNATKKLLKWIKEYNPDIIWLHNIHGYYINVEMLFGYLKKANKKVYWTLHDCWSFTGHCAYFTYARCDKWKTGCHQCIQMNRYPKSSFKDNSRQNYERKKMAFCGVKDMTLITPSQWLADLVKESFLKKYPIEVVRNEINRDVFKPTKSDFRTRYQLEGKKVLLGVASTWEERKGLKDYLELASMLSDDYRMVLVGLNKRQLKQVPDNILGLPKTENAKQLAEIYTAADVHVNLSYEETFGMTIIEAQACGTPVIVYKGTACEEIVNKGKGVVVEQDIDKIFEVIRERF